MADGGSDRRKDAGEEGGAIKGSTMVDEWFGFSMIGGIEPCGVGSGIRMACPIRLLCLYDPKHQ